MLYLEKKKKIFKKLRIWLEFILKKSEFVISLDTYLYFNIVGEF